VARKWNRVVQISVKIQQIKPKDKPARAVIGLVKIRGVPQEVPQCSVHVASTAAIHKAAQLGMQAQMDATGEVMGTDRMEEVSLETRNPHIGRQVAKQKYLGVLQPTMEVAIPTDCVLNHRTTWI